MTTLTQRVNVGAFYTDGRRLGEVVRVHDLGYVDMVDSSTGQPIGRGIDAFRRDWWLVKGEARRA